MATELSRTKDLAHGAVYVVVKDNNGNQATHTIYVLGLNGQTIDQAVAAILASTDAATSAINAAFAAAGLG